MFKFFPYDQSVRGKYNIFVFFKEIFNLFIIRWDWIVNSEYVNKDGNMPKI